MDSTQTKPDALEMLLAASAAANPWFQVGCAIGALEAERRENAERDAKIRELLRRLYDGECPCAAWGESGTLGQAIALLDGGA